MAWMAVCCLLACFARAGTANTENEMSIKELGWLRRLVSLSGDQKELDCVSESLPPLYLLSLPTAGIQLTISSLGPGCFLTIVCEQCQSH